MPERKYKGDTKSQGALELEAPLQEDKTMPFMCFIISGISQDNNGLVRRYKALNSAEMWLSLKWVLELVQRN